ncbi:MAG: cytochrome c-type biogenesis protein CcmH [Acidobacteriota bacterium]
MELPAIHSRAGGETAGASMGESGSVQRQGSGPGQAQRRAINLAVLAGALILLGLVAAAVYRMNRTRAASARPPAAADQPGAPRGGRAVTAAVPIKLTPQARVAAERYRCVCGCNDPLSTCTCSRTPGSRDMKEYLQELVDQREGMQEIDRAMVERYGAAALLSNPPSESGTSGPDR